MAERRCAPALVLLVRSDCDRRAADAKACASSPSSRVRDRQPKQSTGLAGSAPSRTNSCMRQRLIPGRLGRRDGRSRGSRGVACAGGERAAGGGRRLDHDPARALGEQVGGGRAECRARRAGRARWRGRSRRSRAGAPRRRAWPRRLRVRSIRVSTRRPARRPATRAPSSRLRARCSSSGSGASSARRRGHLDHVDASTPASSPTSLAAVRERVGADVGAEDRHERGAVVERREVGRRGRRARAGAARAGRAPMPPAVDEVAGDADQHPGDADRARLGVQRDARAPGGERAERAEHGGERDQSAADAHVPGHPVGALAVGLLDAQRDHRDVRGREREHRAERVEVAEEGRSCPGAAAAPASTEKNDDREPRRAVARVQAREDRRQLAVLGQRPRQPRDADQPGVGGDEQDRRREHADVVRAPIVEHRAVQAERETIPSTGSFSYVVPSAVAKWPPCRVTGSADSATTEMPA